MSKIEKILRFIGIFKYLGHNFMAENAIFKFYMSKCSLDHEESNDIHLMRLYRDLLLLWPDIASGARISVNQSPYAVPHLPDQYSSCHLRI